MDVVSGAAGCAADQDWSAAHDGSAADVDDAAGGGEDDDGEGSPGVAADVEDSAGRAGQAGRAADKGGSAADGAAHRADQEGARLPLLQWMWRMRRIARIALIAQRTTTGRGARAQAVVLDVKLWVRIACH